MPRKPRIDAVGMFHHVMNRGVARRPIFERQDDYQYFKMLLACAVRSSRIRVHGFSLMPNHFHLLAESRDGQLGETMRRVQALYAGWFNRTRDVRRPGHLFGARFKSFPIRDEAYLFSCIGYIDLNPVKAGLCRAPWEYPHGSALPMLTSAPTPPWICTRVMDRILAPLREEGMTAAAAYRIRYGGSRALDVMNVVEACISAPAASSSPDLDGLLGGEHMRRRAWLEHQARLADGTRVSAPIAHLKSVQHAVGAGRARAPRAQIHAASSLSLWDVLEVGLLRCLVALGFRRIGDSLGISTSAAASRFKRHLNAMEDDAYANITALTAQDALRQCYGAQAVAIAETVVKRRLSREVEESS